MRKYYSEGSPKNKKEKKLGQAEKVKALLQTKL